MSWLAKYRADWRALQALDGGRSPGLATAIEAAVLLLVLLDVLTIVAFVPALVDMAVWS